MQYVATNVDEHTQDVHEYDENANYDDVFDTRHVDDIQISTSSAYNSNYKLYFDDEYHDFNHISQLCVDSERVSTSVPKTKQKKKTNHQNHHYHQQQQQQQKQQNIYMKSKAYTCLV